MTGRLDAVGISELEEQIYLFVLQSPEATLQDILEPIAASDAAARRALAKLERDALVSRTPHRPPRFVAASPRVALHGLVMNRQEALDGVRNVARELEGLFSSAAQQSSIPVEIAAGLEASIERYRQIQRTAEQEVFILDKPPYHFDPDRPNQDELLRLKDGVRYRVLYAQESLEAPGKLDNVKTCVAAGEEARVTAVLPMKIIAVDRKIAVTYETQDDEVKQLLVVHPSSLLDALLAFCETLWEQAIPLRFGDREERPAGIGNAVDEHILTLLAAGANDDAIARQLGVNVRTVRRRVAQLLAATGARTRFQAGVQAARHDWV